MSRQQNGVISMYHNPKTMKLIKKAFLLTLCIMALLSQYSCKHAKKAQKPLPPNTDTAILPPEIPDNKPLLIAGYTKDQIYFKVQIGAFVTPLSETDAFFANVAGEETRIDVSPQGLYRYSIGKYTTYEQADFIKAELKKRGYTDSFVAAYGNDDKRIEMPMAEFMKLYKAE